MVEFEAGRIVGSYRVIRRISRHGAGVVYEVEHLRLSGLRYALKAFDLRAPDADGDSPETRFLARERELKALNHAGLTHVFALGVDAASQLAYLVMDLVLFRDGETYTLAHVPAGEVDEEQALLWFGELAAALDYLHAAGLAHGDLRPAHVLVDADMHVRLKDYGLTRAFGHPTADGSGHLAPEVVAGGAPSPAADAYALGILLLRWLIGAETPARPGAPGSLDGLKYDWAPVLARLLAAQPADRPTDLVEMVRAVRRSTEPVAAPRPAAKPAVRTAPAPGPEPSSGERVHAFVSTSVWAAVAGVLVAVSAAMAYVGYRGWRTFDAERKARLDRVADLERRFGTDVPSAPAPAETNAPARTAAQGAAAPEVPAVPSVTEPAPAGTNDAPAGAAPSPAGDVVVPGMPKVKPKISLFVDPPPDADLGFVPDRTYRWFADAERQQPARVCFEQGNGATVDLVPIPAGSFDMRNHDRHPKAFHRVTLTRPFWMSRNLLTPAQLREFIWDELDDCVPVEQALGDKAPVHRRLHPRFYDRFCQYMTRKYRRQLPTGYVFRLPTEAEFARAVDEKGCRTLHGTDHWRRCDVRAGAAQKRFEELRQSCGLDRLGRWVGSARLLENRVLIGGRAADHVCGVTDLIIPSQILYDRFPPSPRNRRFLDRVVTYADEETDPLHWSEDRPFANFERSWQAERFLHSSEWHDWSGFAHLVVGPDLVAEGAWRKSAPKVADAAPRPAPAGRYDWSTPSKVARPLEVPFRLANGETMVFCYCPRANFNMTNSDRNRESHRVRLTQPFWMSKYLVTTRQWRDYSAHDLMDELAEVERLFPGEPLTVPFNRYRLEGFCDYLTRRYGSQLPPGYVFRLPTEAEHEWAVRGDEKADYWSLPSELHPGDVMVRGRFQLLWSKIGKASRLAFSDEGFVGGVFVGGRTQASRFGIHDLFGPGKGHDLITLDTVQRDGGDGGLSPDYAELEVDPLRWEGTAATHVLARPFALRFAKSFLQPVVCHVVIGPDVLRNRKAAEKAPYPERDFGGVLVSPQCRFVGQSSYGWKPIPDREAKLLCADPVPEVDETRAFHTKKEASPWVEVALPRRARVCGLVVENRGTEYGSGIDRAAPLVVQVPAEGGTWREVARIDEKLRRYRIDLDHKTVLCDRLRVGRAPGVREDCFHLQKVMIYVKPEP